MCNCFDCQRRRGITKPVRDCLGRYHDHADGRYESVKLKDGKFARSERVRVPSILKRRKYAEHN